MSLEEKAKKFTTSTKFRIFTVVIIGICAFVMFNILTEEKSDTEKAMEEYVEATSRYIEDRKNK